MPDNRLQVLECEHDVSCSSFACRDYGPKMYYIGNEHSGALYSYPVYCENCIRNMLNTLPSEFSFDGGAIEKRIRAEMMADHAKQLRDALVAHGEIVRKQVTAELIDQFSKPELKDPPAPVVEEVDEDSKHIYRCLDCGDEFESASVLEEHKATHADSAPKRTRKKPS